MLQSAMAKPDILENSQFFKIFRETQHVKPLQSIDTKRLQFSYTLEKQLLPAIDGKFYGEGYLMDYDRQPAELRQLLLDSSKHFPFAWQLFLKHVTDYAIHIHGDDLRKDGKTPYINHPLRVALHLETPLKRAVAVAHDLQEDKGVTRFNLYMTFYKKYGYPPELVDRLFLAIDTLSTKYPVRQNGKKVMYRRAAKHQDKEEVIEKELAYYRNLFEVDRENPELGIAEIKMFDKRDNILSDAIILKNRKGRGTRKIRREARERLQSVLSKTEPFLDILRIYRPDLEKPIVEAMEEGEKLLGRRTKQVTPRALK